MRGKRILCSLTVVAMLLGLTYAVAAQPTSPYIIGTVTLHSTQVAAGVGITWGDGTLMFKNKGYTFQVKGLNAGSVGISKIDAKGDVYNMKDVSEFAGHYALAQAGIAFIKGEKGLIMRNENGVVINLKALQKGVNLSLGGGGMTIIMK